MDIFINSASAISPIESFDKNDIDWEIPEITDGWLKCVEPVYKQYINPGKLRRMARVVRMGVATGLQALKDANIEQPDAIVMGTGLGCVLDTEKFLQQIIENNESLLNPTAFIQSTHNTVSGQIALLLGCHNYNFTFTQKDVSFESALLESEMLIKDNEADSVLVGGVDEMTTNTFQLINEAGCVQSAENKKGYIPGEGAAFFILSNEKSDNSIGKIKGISLSFNISNPAELKEFVSSFINEQGLNSNQIDMLVSGNNCSKSDEKWHAVLEELMPDSKKMNSKKFGGEHDTASAFALWVATQQLSDEVEHILVYNTNQGKSHSVLLLSKC